MKALSRNAYSPLLVPYLLLVAVSVWWAGSYLLMKIAALEMPPATLAATRLIIAAAVLVLWLQLRYRQPLPAARAVWAQYAKIALFGHAVPLFLIAWASSVAPVSEMAVLIATTPLFTALIGHVSERSWPKWDVAFSLIAGFAGLMGFLSVYAGAPDQNWAARLALLAAALSYAISGRCVARVRTGNAIATGAGVMLCAIPMLLPVSLLVEQPWTLLPDAEALVAVVLLGTMSTAIVYVAYYHLIGLSGPVFASMHHYLVPAISLVLGALFFGEQLSGIQIISGLIIAASIFASSNLVHASSAGRANRMERAAS
jgi:drug/metabolite transporter (DMT)-like permease